jgi:hypothetical protein
VLSMFSLKSDTTGGHFKGFEVWVEAGEGGSRNKRGVPLWLELITVLSALLVVSWVGIDVTDHGEQDEKKGPCALSLSLSSLGGVATQTWTWYHVLLRSVFTAISTSYSIL